MPSMMDLSNELGSAALNRGDYKEARKQFRFMVKESLKYGEQEQAVAQNRLGTACTREKRYKEAEEAFRACIELTERAYGASHPAVSAELNNLGFVLWKGFGDRVGAKLLFEKAVQLIENASASASEISSVDRAIFSEAFENLASLLVDQRDFATAEELLRKAIKIQTDGVVVASPTQLRPLMQLVQLIDKQGRSKEARELLDEHLAAAQKAVSAGPIAE
ncbi:MAG: tetratricopeptide repeat protein [Candidatus Melainabacteria bacterium]|nr:tetratricopeptide repeat protein [Candidatus Melainabacteria bacterium]